MFINCILYNIFSSSPESQTSCYFLTRGSVLFQLFWSLPFGILVNFSKILDIGVWNPNMKFYTSVSATESNVVETVSFFKFISFLYKFYLLVNTDKSIKKLYFLLRNVYSNLLVIVVCFPQSSHFHCCIVRTPSRAFLLDWLWNSVLGIVLSGGSDCIGASEHLNNFEYICIIFE